MWKIISFSSLTFCILIGCDRSQEWPEHAILDNDDIFHLYWIAPEDKNSSSEICFMVVLKTNGYFGLGFSPDGGMPGSDIVTGWIKDGKVYFQDRHAVAFSLPPKDDQQDYEVIDAYENSTCTVFVFCRKLDTCDKNDTVIDGSTMRVIYAYSEEDPASDEPFYHHENRGVKSILLLKNKVEMDPGLNYTSLLTWNIISPGVDISSHENLYWCKIYKTPEVSEKNHIVMVKPTFEDGHQQFVHHLAIYQCLGGTADEFEKHVTQKGEECRLPTMPVEILKCQGFTISWSIGGEDIIFPEHVGLPLYPEKYYMFEIHYSNPQLVSPLIDHSGISLYYTPNVRKFDAGNIMIGVPPLLPRVFIPPAQKVYVVVGHSSPQCVPWAENGVKVFSVSPHTHFLARKFKARHFRGEQEIIPLVDDKNYDASHQDYRNFAKEVDIFPGDQISVECFYDSTQRKNVTFGGETTQKEMCMAFLLHYPPMNQMPSLSAPSFTNINKVLHTNITSEADVVITLGSFDWSSVDMDEVQYVMRYSDHLSTCNYGEFSKEGVNPTVSYPRGFKPYEPQSNCNITT